MRIIFLGNPYNRYEGLRNFFYAERFHNGLIRNGHSVYYYADKEDAKNTISGRLIKKHGIQKANKKFLNLVKNIRPHAIIFSHIGVITPQNISEVRSRYPDTKIAYVNVDALFSPRNIENITLMRNYCDHIFMTTGGKALKSYETKDCRFHYIPNITDSSIDIGRAFETETPLFDVASFMHGQHNKKSDQADRLSLAEKVAQIDNIKTCYHGFDDYPGIYGVNYFEALGRSAMTLCLNRHACDGQDSTPETRYMYSSDRTAHVMGNGSMALISKDFALDKLYSDEEVVFFENNEDLIEKVSFYKNNSTARQKIAKKGWKKAHRDLNERVVMRYVIERLFDKKLSQDYAWIS